MAGLLFKAPSDSAATDRSVCVCCVVLCVFICVVLAVILSQQPCPATPPITSLPRPTEVMIRATSDYFNHPAVMNYQIMLGHVARIAVWFS